MRTFTCACGNSVYFENTRCLNCGRFLGFVAPALLLSSFEPTGPVGDRVALHPRLGHAHFRPCRNYSQRDACNWMVGHADPHEYCLSCRLNEVIPNLDDPRRVQLWYEVEKAKRRLLFTLLALDLPVQSKHDAPADGLAFKVLADRRLDTGAATDSRIGTGHQHGVITIALSEADPVMREQMRERMNEGYRTLLGHFRHESGHYYWSRLIQGTHAIEGFRRLFGDERADYGAALASYYDAGPSSDWQQRHVSAYASSHPWEDFAETWAHYMHIVDTLETASDADFQIDGRALGRPTHELEPELNLGLAHGHAEFKAVLNDWFTLSHGMNLLNRSMGLSDAYPFSLSALAVDKLAFVHRTIASS